jgi:hypothetical protein
MSLPQKISLSLGGIKGNSLPRSTLERHVTIPSSSVEPRQTCFSRWCHGEYSQFIVAWFVFGIFWGAGFWSGEVISSFDWDEWTTIAWIAVLLGWVIGLLGLGIQLLVVTKCHAKRGLVATVRWCREHRYLALGSALVILAALGVSIWIAVVCPTLSNGSCRVVTTPKYGWKEWGGYIID